MTTFSLEARNLLERYLAQIGLSLGGAASVDVEEVRRDVREHIDAEIGDREDPVGAPELQRVLDRLGDPGQWVGEDEIPLWRRVLARLTSDEGWRLAHACFALSLAGLALLVAGSAVGVVLMGGGYVLARAGRAHVRERDGTLGARRWLIDSSLLAVALPVLFFVLLGPFLPTGFLLHEEGVLSGLGIPGADADPASRSAAGFQVGMAFATLGTWWVILGLVGARFSRAAARLAVPLPVRPRYGVAVALLGLVLTAAGFLALPGA